MGHFDEDQEIPAIDAGGESLDPLVLEPWAEWMA